MIEFLKHRLKLNMMRILCKTVHHVVASFKTDALHYNKENTHAWPNSITNKGR